MQLDKSDAARAWLRKALRDLDSADRLCKDSPPFTDTALFHAQQAAEKSLKAFLTYHEVSFEKTHDLEEISGRILAIDPTLEPLLKRVSVLTPFAVVFRYPGEDADPELPETLKLIALAREAFDAIVGRLPK